MEQRRKIFEEAKKTVSDSKKLREVVSNAAHKVKNLAANSTEWKELRSKVNVLVSMVQSHLSGKYRAFSNSSLLLVVFALLYFVTPTDAIPDFIPALGFTDDASVLYLIYRKLNKDIERFLQWKGNE